jgi:hypothetical protein
LAELDWPSNHIDGAMCRRALNGLVAKYEGPPTFYAYQAQWAKEDNAAISRQKLLTKTKKHHPSRSNVLEK